MATIGVFCAANPGRSAGFVDTARSLGRAIADAGHEIVYGGGRVGLMGAVADGAIAAGGRVVGYLPDALTARELEHTGIAELHVVATMHERKQAMCDRSDGFVVLPGGFGTLDEVMEILTWNQIGIIAKPVAFLDVDGYYEDLFAFFDRATETGLIRDAHRTMARRVGTVEDALDIATGPAPVSPSKWTDPSVR